MNNFINSKNIRLLTKNVRNYSIYCVFHHIDTENIVLNVSIGRLLNCIEKQLLQYLLLIEPVTLKYLFILLTQKFQTIHTTSLVNHSNIVTFCRRGFQALIGYEYCI